MSVEQKEEKYLTVDEVADELRVTDETVRRWLRAGQIVGLNFGRKAGWRIDRADFEDFVRKSKRAA
jgi:excisionase family DNA binding protein